MGQSGESRRAVGCICCGVNDCMCEWLCIEWYPLTASGVSVTVFGIPVSCTATAQVLYIGITRVVFVKKVFDTEAGSAHHIYSHCSASRQLCMSGI